MNSGLGFDCNDMKIGRYITGFSLAALLWACGENAPDCLQGAGETVREALTVPAFTDITVFENVRLVVRQGPQQEVLIETGENLRPEVSAVVEDGVLVLRDANNCNFFRKYGQTTIRVTTPELRNLRSSTGWPIRSEGTLAFQDLRLISESFADPDAATTDGSFELDLDTGRVQIVANGISAFRLSGQTGELSVTIAAGDSRVEARDLQAGVVRVDHRGSNDLEVYPLQRLEGRIRGYGDVISYNRPDEIAVEVLFRGRLLFADGG